MTHIYLAIVGVISLFAGPAHAKFAGDPWFDVKSAAHGCAAAVGDNIADDTSAIQCHVDYMKATYNGGRVRVAPGNYKISGSQGIIIPAGVWLIGDGASNGSVSSLSSAGDNRVLSFQITGTTCPSGNHYGGMEKVAVFGYANAAATQNTVYIGDGCNVTIRDSIIWFGANALANRGVDSLIQSTFIWGYNSAVYSNGANWYDRVKIDDPIGHASIWGFLQGPSFASLPLAENAFVNCDFSGNYTYSVQISDGNNSSVTKFISSTFSSPFVITNARYVQISAGEFGSATFTMSAGKLVMSASVGLTSITVTGAGSRSCAANSNITC